MPEGSSIARLRRVLLAVLAVAAVALVVLFAIDREPPERVESDEPPTRAAGGDLVMSGEGFRYDYTREGRVVLELRGERMLSDREDNVVLEGVTIRVHREEEGDVAAGEEPEVRTWVIRSRTANYNLVSEHAELEGRVSVVGPDGVSLESERVLVDRGESVEIPVPVVLRMPRGEGLAYAARGERGTYDLQRDQAELAGRALVVACEPGSDAGRRDHELCAEGRGLVLELSSRRFEVHAGSRIVAPGAVRFRYRDLAGSAGSLTATLERQVYRLDDGVEVEAVGPLPGERTPLRLTAERLLFERRERLVRALGGVDLRAGADRLQARRIGLKLAPDERTVESIQVRGSALATRDGREGPGAPPPPRSALFGDRLYLLFDVATGEPSRLELHGMEGRPAALQSTDVAGAGTFVHAPVFHGRYEDGVLRRVEAPGPVRLEERLLLAGSERIAWGCGDRAEVTLADDGEIALASLDGRVETWRDGWHAMAHSARFAGGLGRGELVGAPEGADPRAATNRVRLLRSDGAELLAPRFVLEPAVEVPAAAGEGGSAPLRWHAQGGVRGFVPAGAGLSLGESSAPVRVEADEGLFHTDGRRVVLRGEARVHQGRNVLIAERIEGDFEDELVAARGGVTTFWEDEETARRAAAEASRPPPAPIPLPGPPPPALRPGPGPLPPPGVQWIPESLRPPSPAPEEADATVADIGEGAPGLEAGQEGVPAEPDDGPPPPTRYYQPAPSPVVPGRLEIRSDRMTLYRRSGQLFFVDDVYARQDAISIRCRELEVLELRGGPDGRVTRQLDCRQDVRVDDADAQRVVEGDFARYCEGAEEIRVWGDRVVMRGAPGRAVDGTPIVGSGGGGALIECPAMIYRRGGDASCIEREADTREGCGW